MRSSGPAAAAASLFTPKALKHRLGILAGTFLDHQYERISPLAPMPQESLDGIQSRPVMMPPPSHLGPGSQTIEGLMFLASLALALGARRVFEIGTFSGLTTWTLARNLPGSEIHTIDLPPDQLPSLPLERTDLANRAVRPPRLFEELEHEARVVQHWGDSAEFDFSPWFGGCDLVYIDGAHSEPYVRSDTRTALRLVSPAGAIVWDDYWRHTKGVGEVLHRLQDVPLQRIPGTRLVVALPPR